jgi:hypothetical protein
LLAAADAATNWNSVPFGFLRLFSRHAISPA